MRRAKERNNGRRTKETPEDAMMMDGEGRVWVVGTYKEKEKEEDVS